VIVALAEETQVWQNELAELYRVTDDVEKPAK
jgi:hypothetical protein